MCDTFRANFPGVECWTKDIFGLTGKTILDAIGIERGDLDMLDGSPPCQGFSLAGNKRSVSDKRNDLTMEFARMVEEVSPRVFLMENVPGMAMGTMKGRFLEVLTRLNKGYEVTSAMLDASYYGVPQARRRIIFIGVRRDLGIRPSFPRPGRRTNMADEPILRDILAVNTGQFSKRWKDFTNPSPTMTSKQNLYCLGKDNKKRKITISEAKALCSFPQDFKLTGSYSRQWAELGNAVMPRFMQRLARHIREEILDKAGQTRPGQGQ